MNDKVLAMIMAGGKGSRLFPLTKHRAKPAVPFGGKYRIIDFVLSNFINSGIFSIYVITQFLSQSLTEHLKDGWQFGSNILRDHFITPVPAQMRTGGKWYQGTADAIYQNIQLIENHKPDIVAVFGADHIYRMDIRQMLSFHRAKNSDVTIATLPLPRSEASEFGVIQVDEDWRIIGFQEKPKDPIPIPGQPDMALISMGNYLFNSGILQEVIKKDAESSDSEHDFGKSIFPDIYEKQRLFAYNFKRNKIPGVIASEKNDYWRDVGTLEAYLESHMELLSPTPPFDLYNHLWPIKTASYSSPPAKFACDSDGKRPEISNSIIAEGSIINAATIINSVLGRNIIVESGAHIENSIILNDVRICAGAKIRNSIIDKKVNIAKDETVGYDAAQDRKKYHVSETGIVVIERGSGMAS
ncbi:MAG: glucose-1-phosphate adenylyltransferase [Vulcanimicrobiota bacterium]